MQVSMLERHTPWRTRRWIGNAAEDGRAATVFARLKVPAPDGSGTVVDHGVHAIVVPIRAPGGGLLPGVEILDCGYKVRRRRSLPREALLTGGASSVMCRAGVESRCVFRWQTPYAVAIAGGH
jgi:hypothetical protein